MVKKSTKLIAGDEVVLRSLPERADAAEAMRPRLGDRATMVRGFEFCGPRNNIRLCQIKFEDGATFFASRAMVKRA